MCIFVSGYLSYFSFCIIKYEEWKCVKLLSRVQLFAAPWLLCPWNSLGENTGVGCHFLLHGSSRPRDRTQVSCITGRFFTVWVTYIYVYLMCKSVISPLFSFSFFNNCLNELNNPVFLLFYIMNLYLQNKYLEMELLDQRSGACVALLGIARSSSLQFLYLHSRVEGRRMPASP